MGDERRESTRHKVCGNAEITSVLGRGRVPDERSRLIDWSAGGLCLKVKSPRRRFLIQKLEPVLWEDDTLLCTLRFPPAYKEVTVAADVVHVERCKEEPDLLTVGLRFDTENTSPAKLAELAKSFTPKSRSGRLPKPALEARERLSSRLRVAEPEGEASEAPAKAAEKRPRKRSSGRTSGRTSGRSKRRASQRRERIHSKRQRFVLDEEE